MTARVKKAHRPYPHSGFTLIELVAVIVILGIVAAIAVPRFVDLKQAALLGTMDAMTGAMRSGANLVHARAIVDGVADQASASVTLDGITVDIAYGYPTGTATGIDVVMQASSGWQKRASTFSGAWVYWHGVINEDAGVAQCYLRYRQVTTAGDSPVIDVETSGC